MVPELTNARLVRAVREIRRTYRQILTDQIDAVEADLEGTIGGYLPVRSQTRRLANGNRSGEDELVGRLREATAHGRYQLPHHRVLTRSGGCSIDELTSSGNFRSLDPEVVVKEIAAKLEFARLRRGRGGRYGAISWGIQPEFLREIGAEGLDGEIDDEALAAEDYVRSQSLDQAAKQLGIAIRQALKRPDAATARVLRNYVAALIDENAPDEDYRSIFGSSEQEVLAMVVGGRLTWRKLAIHTLLPTRRSKPRPMKAILPPVTAVAQAA